MTQHVDVGAVVLAAVAAVLEAPGATLSDNFFELGGDSLAALELAARLEQALGRAVPLDAIYEADDLRSYTDRVAAAPAGA